MRLNDVKPLFENKGQLTTVTPSSVPATISRAMAPAGLVEPKWKMVADMPGYLAQSIRQLGAAVFDQYTSTPIDQIQVVANVQGQGPNDLRELNALGKWVIEKGTPVTDGEIDFEGSIPGYKAQVKVFNVGDVQVMLVKDGMGQYAYAWPSAHSKSGQAAIGDKAPALSAPEQRTEPQRELPAPTRQADPAPTPRREPTPVARREPTPAARQEPAKPPAKEVKYVKPEDDDIFDWS
jgi:hypothetical protein